MATYSKGLGTNLNHKLRASGNRAIQKKWSLKKIREEGAKASRTGGMNAMVRMWEQIIDDEGPAKFVELFSKFVPKEMNLDEESRVIHVVGMAPPKTLEWAKQYGLQQSVTVDQKGTPIEDMAKIAAEPGDET